MMGLGAVWAVLALLVVYALGSRTTADQTMRPIRTLSDDERRVVQVARREMEASEDNLF